MAQVEVGVEGEDVKHLLTGDRGLAELLKGVLNQVLEAEITEHLGAEPHERTPERRGRRNGHYARSLTTRVGTLELRVPRDREGRLRRELFQCYQSSEKARVLALMEMVVNGVSTRKVARITDELCGREFKRSTVSELAKGLDGRVEAWNERPLEGRYPFVLVDAMHIKVRRQQSVHSTSVLIAVGVNEEGYREILGSRIVDSDSEQSWLETLRWLKARGLGGVELVVSDAHQGLVSALERSFQGAVWQRCQVYFRKNLTDRAPKSVQDALHRGLDRIFDAERTTSPPGSPSPPSATSWPAGRIGRWLRMDTFQNWKRNRDTPALGQVA